MANDRYYQFLYSKHPMLTMITGVVTFGATGSVSAYSGAGVSSVTRLTTGIYKIKLTQNFPGFVKGFFDLYAGTTGSPVNDGSLVVGTPYQITSVGTTAWTSYGFDSQYTPAVGAPFVATSVGGAGSGTATAIGNTALVAVEILQSQTGLLTNTVINQNVGSALLFQTKTATATVASPTSGAQIGFSLFYRNSSSQY